MLTTTYNGDYNFSMIIFNFKKTYPIALWKKGPFFEENFIETINIHWLKYSPPVKTNHYILAALYICIMTVGSCGNAFVMFMFLRYPTLRTSANILVMNLAASDLLMMSKMPIFIFNSIRLGPALGKIGCSVYGFIGALSGTVSICTLAAISLDRYYVIKFPLNIRFTKLRAQVSLFFCWFYGAIFSIMPLFNLSFGTYVPEGYLTSCSFDYLSSNETTKSYIFVFFVFAWVFPFILITFCYVTIFSIVRRNTRNIARKGSESWRHVKLEEKRKQEVKLAVTIFAIVVLWFAAWTPYSVVALLGIFGKEDMIPPTASMIPALFCKTASCVDPFVYALTSPKFKIEIRKLFTRNTSAKCQETRTSSITNIQRELKKTSHLNNCQDLYVEEEFIPVPITNNHERIKNERSKYIDTEQISHVFDLEHNIIKISNLKPMWWYRPSFSNRSSSLKKLVRKWSSRERGDLKNDPCKCKNMSNRRVSM